MERVYAACGDRIVDRAVHERDAMRPRQSCRCIRVGIDDRMHGHVGKGPEDRRMNVGNETCANQADLT
jgi:hypothetical protein